ncbi:sensor histidine kinase [Flexivirga meconopsidis]|uniref:sensor histidine kinase n=1 Tax=Flexivirga meconopsidis TaxID=2977121 RepID=UPI00223EFA93|nr:histidine kinase [Flexivirga meconopsidis]
MTTASIAPWWRSRRLLGVLSTVLIVFVSFGAQIMSAAFAQYRHEGITDQQLANDTQLDGIYLAASLIGFGLALLLIWRHRWPVWISLGICALTVVLPLDGLTPLFALYAVALVVTGPWLWGCIAATVAAELVATWRDSRGTKVSSWMRGLASIRDGAEFPWWLVGLVALLLVAVTVGLAWLVRSRRDLTVSRAQETRSETKLHALGEELARQTERERIAREVHDVLGHRLSLLSLHAAGLELAADDPKLAKSAALVREGAQESMNDLRSLLAVLRRPEDPDVSETVPTLRELPSLIDESLAAGSPVAAAVFIDQSATLDERVGRSAYRITQELLTNARRHAPGVPVRLQIDAGPERGVEISTANRAADPGDRRVRPGNGLTGVHERVQQAGGDSWVWIDDEGAFRTLVRLPWEWKGAADE